MVTGATQPRIQATVEQATANHRDSPVEPGAKEPLEQAWPLTHRAGVAGLPVMIRAPVCVPLVITLWFMDCVPLGRRGMWVRDPTKTVCLSADSLGEVRLVK